MDQGRETAAYASLVARGPSKADQRDIQKDVSRVFADDEEFVRKTPNAVLSRLLHALSHALRDAAQAASRAADTSDRTDE